MIANERMTRLTPWHDEKPRLPKATHVSLLLPFPGPAPTRLFNQRLSADRCDGFPTVTKTVTENTNEINAVTVVTVVTVKCIRIEKHVHAIGEDTRWIAYARTRPSQRHKRHIPSTYIERCICISDLGEAAPCDGAVTVEKMTVTALKTNKILGAYASAGLSWADVRARSLPGFGPFKGPVSGAIARELRARQAPVRESGRLPRRPEFGCGQLVPGNRPSALCAVRPWMGRANFSAATGGRGGAISAAFGGKYGGIASSAYTGTRTNLRLSPWLSSGLSVRSRCQIARFPSGLAADTCCALRPGRPSAFVRKNPRRGYPRFSRLVVVRPPAGVLFLFSPSFEIAADHARANRVRPALIASQRKGR